MDLTLINYTNFQAREMNSELIMANFQNQKFYNLPKNRLKFVNIQ